MFGTILTSIVTIFHLYVFWRVSTLTKLTRRISRRQVVLAGLVMWGLFMVGRLYGHDNPGLLAGVLEHLSMNWMAALFLTSVCLLFVDLVTGFGWLWPRQVARLRGLGLATGVLLSIIALVQGLRPPVITDYEVTLPGLSGQLDGTVIVAASDLHLGSRLDANWLMKRVAQIQLAQPDLIVLLGDIYEGHNDPSPESSAALSRLKAPLGVWAVLGNHEFHRGGESKADVFTQNGFTVLRNRWAEIDHGLVLVGVDDLTNGQRNGQGHELLQRALANKPAGPIILLSHSPLYDKVAAEAGVGLMLSGHTHGGQIWPFSFLVQQRYPLLTGRYQTEGMTTLVCRGTGTWGPRMRLWAPAEIMRITLKSSP
jgi:predicted MPP superfamily phosphohydrolase